MALSVLTSIFEWLDSLNENQPSLGPEGKCPDNVVPKLDFTKHAWEERMRQRSFKGTTAVYDFQLVKQEIKRTLLDERLSCWIKRIYNITSNMEYQFKYGQFNLKNSRTHGHTDLFLIKTIESKPEDVVELSVRVKKYQFDMNKPPEWIFVIVTVIIGGGATGEEHLVQKQDQRLLNFNRYKEPSWQTKSIVIQRIHDPEYKEK